MDPGDLVRTARVRHGLSQADLAEHAARLVDVLLLADAVGHRPPPPLAFPRIDSERRR